jgi:hypothetical protein
MSVKEELDKLANEIAEKANECCHRLLALTDLENVAGLSQWIPIRDQDPPKGKPVLITDGKIVVVSFWERRHEGFVEVYRGPPPASPNDPPTGEPVLSLPLFEYIWEGYGFGLDSPSDWEWTFRGYEITHWMPLPALPGKEVITNDSKR